MENEEEKGDLVGNSNESWKIKIKMSASQPEITLLSITDTPGRPVGVTAFDRLIESINISRV